MLTIPPSLHRTRLVGGFHGRQNDLISSLRRKTVDEEESEEQDQLKFDDSKSAVTRHAFSRSGAHPSR